MRRAGWAISVRKIGRPRLDPGGAGGVQPPPVVVGFRIKCAPVPISPSLDRPLWPRFQQFGAARALYVGGPSELLRDDTAMRTLIIGVALVLSLVSSPLTERPRPVIVRALRVRLADNGLRDYQVFLVTFDALFRNSTSGVLSVSPSRVHLGSTEQELSPGEWRSLGMEPLEIESPQSHRDPPPAWPSVLASRS